MSENKLILMNSSRISENDFEPYSLMRSNEILGEQQFSIWKITGNKQTIHTHDYYQIWYISKGNCKHKIDNKSFSLSAGDLIIIPPFSYHSMTSDYDDLEVIGIDFTENYLSELDNNTIFLACIKPLFVREKEKQSVFTEIAFKELIEEMLKEHILKSKFSELIIKSNLLKLIILLERKSGLNESVEHSLYNNAVGEALRYIHNNIESKITIEDLCRVSKLSPTSLGVHFKKATGKSAIQYINSIRTDKAKQLLKETDMSVTDISYELGFSDSAYFNRVFKKETQYSPKDYRQKHTAQKSVQDI